MIVSFSVATVSPITLVGSYVYWTGSSLGTRHMDYNHLLSINTVCICHTVGKDIAAHFLSVVDGIPEVLQQTMGVFEAFYEK